LTRNIKKILQLLLFTSLGLGIMYWVFVKQQEKYRLQCALEGIVSQDCDLAEKIWKDFASVNPYVIAMVIALYMISNISRSIRWSMLLETLGKKPKFLNVLGTVMLGYFANLGFPRSGEFIKAGALSRYENIGLDKTMGTVVTDRLIDLVSLLMVVTLAFLLEYHSVQEWVQAHIALPSLRDLFQSSWLQGSLLLITLTVLIFVVYIKKNKNPPLLAKILKIMSGFAKGITSIKRVKNPLWFAFHSINIWVMYFGMTYLCFFAFEPTAHLSIRAALMVFVFGSLGVVFPSPGGMGTFHYLATTALEIYGIESSEAFSMSNILYFSLQIFGNIVFGLLAILMLALLNKKSKTL
jgi:glycosyltransferase 2 family protein